MTAGIRRRIESFKTYRRLFSAVHAATGQSLPRVIGQLAWFRLRHAGSPQVFATLGLAQVSVTCYADYISESDSKRLQEVHAPPTCRALEENKLAFEQRCADAGLRYAGTAAVWTSDAANPSPWTGNVLRTAEDLDRFMQRIGDADLILKPQFGGSGYGVYSLRIRGGVPCAADGYSDAVALQQFLASSPYGRRVWMIQEKLTPHAAVMPLMPGPGVGTVRVHTFLLADGSVQVRWPLMRLPGPGKVTDNFELGTRTSSVAAIDVETGRITRYIAPVAGSILQQLERHAETGVVVPGFRLPDWDSVLELVRLGATAFPELPALGWDIVLTSDGPRALETNWQFGPTVVQAAHRRGIRAELADLLGRLAPSRTFGSWSQA